MGHFQYHSILNFLAINFILYFSVFIYFSRKISTLNK